jgi:hypothetical protein
MAGMSTSDAVDGCSTSVRVAWIWVPLKLSKAKLSTTFVAVHESGDGPSRRLVRCSDMSGVEVKADSKSMTSFGRE